jgi:nucleoside-diphosphate-sugar epimerase
VLDEPHGGPLKVWGSGDQVRNYLYVEDCARMILDCIADTHSGAFAIRAIPGVDMTVRDLVNTIMAAMDSPREVVFEEDAPTGTTKKAADSGAPDGLTPIYTGMRKTVEWIKEHK